MIASVSSIDIIRPSSSSTSSYSGKTLTLDRFKEEALFSILDQGVFEKLFETFCLSQEDPISQIKEKIAFLSQVKIYKEKESADERKQIALKIYHAHFHVNGSYHYLSLFLLYFIYRESIFTYLESHGINYSKTSTTKLLLILFNFIFVLYLFRPF